jgi:hypothetical protein
MYHKYLDKNQNVDKLLDVSPFFFGDDHYLATNPSKLKEPIVRY